MAYTRAGLQMILDHANKTGNETVRKQTLADAIQNMDELKKSKDEMTDILRKVIESDPFVDYHYSEYKTMVYIQGTPAIHKMGNIQRDYEGSTEYFSVRGENTNFYHGMFVEGFGFINVYVPKSGMRELTQEESDYMAKARFGII